MTTDTKNFCRVRFEKLLYLLANTFNGHEISPGGIVNTSSKGLLRCAMDSRLLPQLLCCVTMSVVSKDGFRDA
jgi:hypothetical protein